MTVELMERCRKLGADRGRALLADGWDVEDVAMALEEIAEEGRDCPEYALLDLTTLADVPGILEDLRAAFAHVPDVNASCDWALSYPSARSAWQAYIEGLRSVAGGDQDDR